MYKISEESMNYWVSYPTSKIGCKITCDWNIGKVMWKIQWHRKNNQWCSCCQNESTIILFITHQSNLINIILECLSCYFLRKGKTSIYVCPGGFIYIFFFSKKNLFLTALLLSSDTYNQSILVTGTYYWTSNNICPPLGIKDWQSTMV